MNNEQPVESAQKVEQNLLTQPKKKKKGALIVVIIALLVLGAGTAGYFVVINKDDKKVSNTQTTAKTTPATAKTTDTVVKNAQIPTPKTKMIASTRTNGNGEIWLLNPVTAKYKAIDNKDINCCVSGVDSGESYKTLPNKLETLVVIKDKGLFILSHEDFKTYQINSQPNIGGILDITPDSTKAIVYYQYGTIGDVDPAGMSSSAKLTGYSTVGYQLLDIASGTLQPLSQVEHPSQFVGNTKILAIKEYSTDQKSANLFDLTSGEFTQAAASGNWGFGFIGGQMDFNSDGSKWAYMNSKATESGNLYIRDFPNGEEKSIVSGSWAQYQMPVFSEDSTKVYFVAKGAELAPGVNQDEVWQYDVATGQNSKVTDGTFIAQSGDKLFVTMRNADISKLQLVEFDQKSNTRTDVTPL